MKIPGRVALFMICLLPAGLTVAMASTPRLSSDSEIATAGFFRLSWETDAARVEVQEATSTDFQDAKTVYTGRDRAAVMSGKSNGTWYYRVRGLSQVQAGPWSQAVAVTVAHHRLSRALMYLLLGVIVFVAILTMVVRGSRNTQ